MSSNGSTRVMRRETFNAGHRLFRPDWSDEQNYRVFGKCSNPTGHGHNYTIEVTLEGPIDPETGYVFDLKQLSDIISKRVLHDVDHHNLNTDVEWLAGKNPTAEVLVEAFWERLEPDLPTGLLASIKISETEKNWAEKRRP
ncbi:MAG: 6-carboxytetrahydropterin synthase [Actinomycetota bacterium]|nr:6-carboxytetrahydropterin synthase [Actinomycetota bacterium]